MNVYQCIEQMPVKKWRENWLEVAERFSRKISDRCGLCCESNPIFRDYIDDWREDMYDILDAYNQEPDDYWFPLVDTPIDNNRIFQCCWFAALTPKEFVEVCKAPREEI